MVVSLDQRIQNSVNLFISTPSFANVPRGKLKSLRTSLTVVGTSPYLFQPSSQRCVCGDESAERKRGSIAILTTRSRNYLATGTEIYSPASIGGRTTATALPSSQGARHYRSSAVHARQNKLLACSFSSRMGAALSVVCSCAENVKTGTAGADYMVVDQQRMAV